MSVQSNKRAAAKSKTASKPTKLIIKKSDKLPDINLTPISNWMVTTAYIEAQENSLFAGGSYQPTFLNMQRVVAVGPRVEDIKVGDWVYIDMSRFIKTTKKKSQIKAGIGGQDMIEEKLVPPIFAAPGSLVTYFKINDREIEGVINDPYTMKKEYDTLEAFLERQEKMKQEAFKAQEAADKAQAEASKPENERKGPVIYTETSPNLTS